MHKLAFFAGLLALQLPAFAQQTEPGVPIVFLPPPMEGTLSLGVYAKDGKLVRTLRTEATPEKDFTVGLNGLILQWDGRDDEGKPAAKGSYQMRGFAVGSMKVDGEAFHGNDWIVDAASPRVKRVLSMKTLEAGRLQILAKLADDSSVTLQSDAEGHLAKGADSDPDRAESGDGVDSLLKTPAGALPNLEKPRDASRGVNGSIWVIDETTAGVEVKQYSAEKEFLRRLAIGGHDPSPQQIAASPKDERIYLLETEPGLQRVRGLSLQATTDGGQASTWQTFFTKTIHSAESYAAIAPSLDRPEYKPEEKLHLKLVPNSLFKEAPGSVDVQIGIDDKGSFLRTADGLPLSRLTDTSNLRWAVIGRDGHTKSLTVFQSDGAVVEEFRIKQAANMMEFNAGEYELKR